MGGSPLSVGSNSSAIEGGSGTEPPSFSPLGLSRGGLAALAAGGFLLRRRPALLRARARRGPGAGLLAAAARRAGRVRDLRRPLLRHAFVFQLLVLLLVLHVCAFAGHRTLLCRSRQVGSSRAWKR